MFKDQYNNSGEYSLGILTKNILKGNYFIENQQSRT